MRIILAVILSSASLNIFTLVKMMFGIASFKDTIYSGKFFTIHYVYSKKELSEVSSNL